MEFDDVWWKWCIAYVHSMSMLFSLINVFRTGFLTTMFCLFSLVGQKQQSVDQFLSRLPQSVIKDGKIIDVRSGIANVIKVCNSMEWSE